MQIILWQYFILFLFELKSSVLFVALTLYVCMCVCSVAVLVHNTSRNVFVFVRQFRPGMVNDHCTHLIRICCIEQIAYSIVTVQRCCIVGGHDSF